MKLLFIFLITTTPIFSTIGKHNFVINAGVTVPIDLFEGGLGYGVNTEVGYLLHSVRENRTVHSLDVRLGFNALTINYDEESRERYHHAITQNISGYTTLNYSVGIQFNTMRWMFDIIGIGGSFGMTKHLSIAGSIFHGESQKIVPSYNFVGIRTILPLGMYLAFNNGLYLGIRQTYDFYFDPKDSHISPFSIAYNIHFNIGYVFGK